MSVCVCMCCVSLCVSILSFKHVPVLEWSLTLSTDTNVQYVNFTHLKFVLEEIWLPLILSWIAWGRFLNAYACKKPHILNTHIQVSAMCGDTDPQSHLFVLIWRSRRLWSVSSSQFDKRFMADYYILKSIGSISRSAPASASSRLTNTDAHSTDSPLHFCVHLFVFFLRFDQTLPFFVRVASYWSEGTK